MASAKDDVRGIRAALRVATKRGAWEPEELQVIGKLIEVVQKEDDRLNPAPDASAAPAAAAAAAAASS